MQIAGRAFVTCGIQTEDECNGKKSQLFEEMTAVQKIMGFIGAVVCGKIGQMT